MGGMGFGEGVQIHGASFLIRGKGFARINTSHPTKIKGHRTPPVVSLFRPAKALFLKGQYSAFGLGRIG